MRRGPRGGPGDYESRIARADVLLAEASGAAREPLVLLAAVLRHQQVASRDLGGDGGEPADLAKVSASVDALARSVPEPLAEVGANLRGLGEDELGRLVDTWNEDPALVDPRVGFWLHVTTGPQLEQAAAKAEVPADWQGSACPACGGRPQASVIAEESGEFMAGSPRSLVCGRCATWWPFRRATCVNCHEEDPRLLDGFLEDARRWARVDTCGTCRSYVKTFDLRQPGARDVVPLVDDVATLTLDVWAQQRGYTRPSPSLAGV